MSRLMSRLLDRLLGRKSKPKLSNWRPPKQWPGWDIKPSRQTRRKTILVAIKRGRKVREQTRRKEALKEFRLAHPKSMVRKLTGGHVTITSTKHLFRV